MECIGLRGGVVAGSVGLGVHPSSGYKAAKKSVRSQGIASKVAHSKSAHRRLENSFTPALHDVGQESMSVRITGIAMKMKQAAILGPGAIAAFCLQTMTALATEPTSPAYVSQANGLTTSAMDLKDVMEPIRDLASALPKIPSGQGNLSLVLQKGRFNSASVVQSGGLNTAFVAQSGTRNTVSVQQLIGNSQVFAIQNGVGNIASITQR